MLLTEPTVFSRRLQLPRAINLRGGRRSGGEWLSGTAIERMHRLARRAEPALRSSLRQEDAKGAAARTTAAWPSSCSTKAAPIIHVSRSTSAGCPAIRTNGAA